MSRELGAHGPDEYWAKINDQAQAQPSGTVRITSHIRYGMGYGIRFTDLTVDQAEKFGVELIQAAQLAHDMKARADEQARLRLEQARQNLDAALAERKAS